jgi:hypothetical protein
VTVPPEARAGVERAWLAVLHARYPGRTWRIVPPPTDPPTLHVRPWHPYPLPYPPSADGWYWLSTERMTVAVRIERTKVVDAPPIVRKFIGQRALNLIRWLASQDGFASAYLGA